MRNLGRGYLHIPNVKLTIKFLNEIVMVIRCCCGNFFVMNVSLNGKVSKLGLISVLKFGTGDIFGFQM